MNSSGIIARGQTANQAATGTAINGMCLLVGIRCVTSTSLIISVYDNTSAAGKAIFSSLALVAGTQYGAAAAGGAVLRCANGVHVVFESGSGSIDVMVAE